MQDRQWALSTASWPQVDTHLNKPKTSVTEELPFQLGEGGLLILKIGLHFTVRDTIYVL